jgi:hypothetical protein
VLAATGVGVVGLGALTVLGVALMGGSDEQSERGGSRAPAGPGMSVGDLADPDSVPSVDVPRPSTAASAGTPAAGKTGTTPPSAPEASASPSPSPSRTVEPEPSPSASVSAGWPSGDWDDDDDDDDDHRGNGWGNSTRRPR